MKKKEKSKTDLYQIRIAHNMAKLERRKKAVEMIRELNKLVKEGI